MCSTDLTKNHKTKKNNEKTEAKLCAR